MEYVSINWQIVKDIINYEDNDWSESNKKVGFQYVDWVFEGDDIIAVSRTAFNNAYNYHNANHITFHRIKDYKNKILKVNKLIGGIKNES